MTARHRLLIVRHAKSDYPLGVADHDRPLNDRGRRDAPFIGAWIAAHVPLADDEKPLVLVSSANRTQLTWQRATNGLKGRWTACEVRTEPRIYEAGLSTIQALVHDVPDDVQTCVLVGHNPTMCDAVAYYAQDSALKEQALVKFPTSSVAVLEADHEWTVGAFAAGGWTLTDFVVPRA